MKLLDFAFFFVFLIFLALGIYFLWLNFPTQPAEFETFTANYSNEFPENSNQFYKNMRYPDSKIAYFLAETCSQKKKNDFISATEFLSEKTVLSFYQDERADIVISCTNIAPEPDEEGHFVAGEGGPAIIINASKFSVITLGKVALYRPETCNTPQIATHEILHALGFDHNSNPQSIMYPVTNCDQTLDQEIIDTIRSIYATPSMPDLSIEFAKANKTGRYLSLETTVANYGLKTSEEAQLQILADGTTIENFEIGELTIGSKKELSITNLGIPRSTEKIKLRIETAETEISRENNIVEINLI